jgi:hypothetical protein
MRWTPPDGIEVPKWRCWTLDDEVEANVDRPCRRHLIRAGIGSTFVHKKYHPKLRNMTRPPAMPGGRNAATALNLAAGEEAT